MNPTPRTDAEVAAADGHQLVTDDFARELESENTDLREELAAEQAAMSRAVQDDAALRREIDRLSAVERENAELRAERDRLQFLLWHQHYNHAKPLTAEEMDHMTRGAPPERNA